MQILTENKTLTIAKDFYQGKKGVPYKVASRGRNMVTFLMVIHTSTDCP